MKTPPDAFFELDNYRTLLKQRYVHLKSTTKKISLQKLADQSGLSKSYLNMVLDGQRHLSLDKVGSIVKTFGMSRSQASYFYFLFLENLANDAEIKSFFGSVLKMLRSQQRLELPDMKEQLKNEAIFQSALHMIIKSLKRFPSFKNSPSWIANQLNNKNIRQEQIQPVLDELKLDTGDFDEFAQGRPAPSPNSFERYKIGLGLAAQATEEPVTYRPLHFDMCSLAMDRESEKKAFEYVHELREKLKELAKNSKNPNSVIFVTNNIFCVANENSDLSDAES